MKQSPKIQKGFHLVIVGVVLLVVGVIGFAGYRVLSQKDNQASNNSQGSGGDKSTGPVTWAFDEQRNAWFAKTGTAATCADPFVFDRSPVDLTKIMVISMPGQYRGFNYKPHGGFRLANEKSGQIEVVMPTDATLVSLTRYYEGNPAELQYLLTFETDCGIAFRFDHLQALSPAFQRIAETTPEPKINDTRTNPNVSFTRTKFKSGDVVATAVGFPSTKNFGFDFGVYDYRRPNAISRNARWSAIHNQYTSQEWFGTCWIEQLPASNANQAARLSKVVVNPARPNIISDYCKDASYTTLDFNNGQPTDG